MRCSSGRSSASSCPLRHSLQTRILFLKLILPNYIPLTLPRRAALHQLTLFFRCSSSLSSSEKGSSLSSTVRVSLFSLSPLRCYSAGSAFHPLVVLPDFASVSRLVWRLVSRCIYTYSHWFPFSPLCISGMPSLLFARRIPGILCKHNSLDCDPDIPETCL